MSELKRKKNESFEAFMRRTKQMWQRSGILFQARKIQFFQPKKSKNVKKTQTVSKVKKVAKINRLRKTGKLPADDYRNRRRR